MITKEEIIEILKTVMYPELGRDIVSFGFVKDVLVRNSSVEIKLEITTKDYSVKEKIEIEIRNKLSKISEITDLEINIGILNPETGQKEGHTVEQKDFVPQIKNKIAVASGKGGVGKSTVSVNIAVSLGLKGYKVGLLDADIYGPSIPMMMNVDTEELTYKNKKIIPLKKYGIKLMSIGFLLKNDVPLIWRGPMITKVLQQFLTDVEWGNLDYLIIDLPPGTGDAQLTISQSLHLSGAVIVTTPQDISLIDAAKGVQMFLKVNVPVTGIVENMSYFICPHCGEKTEIFGSGGGLRESSRLRVPFLGEIPLNPSIRISGDSGKPIVYEDNNSEISKAFDKIIEKIIN